MSRELNDKKRAEMQTQVNRLFGLGWSTAQLAAAMGVGPGAVRTWARAESMGTNAQREHLAKLGKPAEERARLLQEADRLTNEADAQTIQVASILNLSASARDRRMRGIALYRLRAATIRKLFA